MKSDTVTQMKPETTLPNSQSESEVTKSEVDLQEQIRRRAYELYEQRAKEDGHDVDDWLQAESEARALVTKPLLRTTSDAAYIGNDCSLNEMTG